MVEVEEDGDDEVEPGAFEDEGDITYDYEDEEDCDSSDEEVYRPAATTKSGRASRKKK